MSKEPIYEQIKRQIKSQILQGKLAEEEMLPSIRSLAKDLQVSVITTKRAYDDLEIEGYIATMPGKGSYVLGQNKERIREQKICEIEEMLQKAIEKADHIALSKEDLIRILETLYET